MANYYKSTIKFNSPNGALCTRESGSTLLLNGANGIINVSGDIGYASELQTPPTTWYGQTLSGFEFGSNNIFVPKDWNINHWKHNGANIVRLPIKWEYIQPTLLGPLDPIYVSEVKSVITKCNSLGLTVILDLHNFGKYNNLSSNFTQENMVDVWTKIVAEFDSFQAIQYDLMNEPGTTVSGATQAAIYNACIAAIRAVAPTKIIHIPIRGSSGINSLFPEYTSYISLLALDANCLVQMHLYPDVDGSGTHSDVRSTAAQIYNLSAAFKLARLKGFKLFFGEVGTGYSANSLTWIDNFFDLCAKHKDVCAGWCWWADGGVWGDTYVNACTKGTTGWDYANGTAIRKFMKTGVWTKLSPRTGSGYPVAIRSGTPVYSALGMTGGCIIPGPTAAGYDQAAIVGKLLSYTYDFYFSVPVETTLTSDKVLAEHPNLSIWLNSNYTSVNIFYSNVTTPNFHDGNTHLIRVRYVADGSGSATAYTYFDGSLIHTKADTRTDDIGAWPITFGGGSDAANSACVAGAFFLGAAYFIGDKGAPTGVTLTEPAIPDGTDLDHVYTIKCDASGAKIYVI